VIIITVIVRKNRSFLELEFLFCSSYNLSQTNNSIFPEAINVGVVDHKIELNIQLNF